MKKYKKFKYILVGLFSEKLIGEGFSYKVAMNMANAMFEGLCEDCGIVATDDASSDAEDLEPVEAKD